MGNRSVPIGELFNLEKGELQSTKCTPGNFDFITAAECWKTHNKYAHECEALIIAVAASGSLGRTHYVNGKFITSDLCFILTPINKEKYPINLSFYHFVFNSIRPKLVAKTKSGTSKESINQTNFKNYELPYFDINQQDFWVEILKNTSVRKELLSSEITHQQTLLKKLRQQILQEAIEGKLTAGWRTKNSSPAKGRCPEGAEGSGAEGLGPEGLNPNQGRPTRSGAMVKSKRTFTLPHLTTFRKSLRKNLTPAEAKLWTLLKGKQLQGRKFRRQHSVANYILDFYCPAEKLAIELDGEGHNNPQVAEHDEERGIFLEHTGIKVLRFENKAVFENPEGVLAMIEQGFNFSGPSPSAPDPSAPLGHLPLAGEEFESADELLERIRVEKERLVKAGEIRKQKPLPPIRDDEKPFELPEGWEWCRVNDLAHLKSGNQYRYTLSSGGIMYIKISDMNLAENKSEITVSSTYFEADQVKKSDLILLNSIIFPKRGGAIATNKRRIVLNKKLLVDSNTMAITPSNLISFYYFKLWFDGVNLSLLGNDSVVPQVNNKDINPLLIPLPPLSEQQAIVAKVGKLLAVCDQLETQITENQTHAKSLMQAVLKEAFSHSNEPPA